MEVQFRRTSERRYALTVHRKDLPPLEWPAFGYDALMPHDLLHFIVERELGMTRGIFGFWAGGGEREGPDHVAGESKREAKRRRRRAERHDEKLLARGARDDGDRSERATFLCEWEWSRRSRNPARRARVEKWASGAHPRDFLPADENEALSEPVVARILRRMDELSARWSGLEVGQFFSVEWPDRLQPRALMRG